MKKTFLQKISFKGRYKITVADVSSPEARAEEERISTLTGQAFDTALKAFNERYGVKTLIFENVTCTAGFTEIAKALSGNISATSEILCNYIALGDSSTTPVTGDTTLGNEVYRKLLASKTYSANKFYATGFFLSTDTNGTYEEVGIFIAGSASADSGALLSHLLLNSLSKTNVQSLTLEIEITMQDA